MSPGEKRQARRIIRHMKTLEREWFEIIAELQDASNTPGSQFDWQDLWFKIKTHQDAFPLIRDLVANMATEASPSQQ